MTTCDDRRATQFERPVESCSARRHRKPPDSRAACRRASALRLTAATTASLGWWRTSPYSFGPSHRTSTTAAAIAIPRPIRPRRTLLAPRRERDMCDICLPAMNAATATKCRGRRRSHAAPSLPSCRDEIGRKTTRANSRVATGQASGVGPYLFRQYGWRCRGMKCTEQPDPARIHFHSETITIDRQAVEVRALECTRCHALPSS